MYLQRISGNKYSVYGSMLVMRLNRNAAFNKWDNGCLIFCKHTLRFNPWPNLQCNHFIVLINSLVLSVTTTLHILSLPALLSVLSSFLTSTLLQLNIGSASELKSHEHSTRACDRKNPDKGDSNRRFYTTYARGWHCGEHARKGSERRASTSCS